MGSANVRASRTLNGIKVSGNNRKITFLWNKVDQVFFGDMTVGKVNWLLIFFGIITVLEVMAYLYKGIFSMIAARCWLLMGLACLIAIAVYFVKAILQDVKEKQFFSLAAVLLLLTLLISFWGNINLSDINPDATQQAAAGLSSFEFQDLNYTGKAFLGYPNRQYILAAVPALLFGRSIFTLHMGFGYPFLLGLIMMYCALGKWARKQKINANITILPLYAFPVFPYITEYYANFEQAFYPIAFTMLGIGFFLLFLCEPNVISSIGLAWFGGLLSNSYTPALASLGLMVVFVAVTIFGLSYRPEKLPFKIRSPRLVAKVLILIEINAIVFFLATLLSKREDRITQLRSDKEIFKISFQSIYEFITEKNAVFLGMVGMIVLIYLVAGLTFRLKLRDFLLSLWILGVVAASNLMLGYIAYEPAWILQRSLIIIPVVITAVTLTVFDFMSKYKLKAAGGFVVVIAISFALIGLNNFKQVNQSFLYFHYIQSMKYMWEDLEHTIKEKGLEAEDEINLVLYTDNILIKNPMDYSKFFYPNAKVYTPDQGVYPSEIDSSLRTFLYGENGLPELEQITETEVKTFENKKYKVIINWHKGVVE